MSKDIKQRVRHTKDSFIEVCQKIHDNAYDYSLVEYINSYTKVKISCPKHGVFEQRPSFHLSGDGCKKCGYEKPKGYYHISQVEFLERSIGKHGRKYDYSKVNYVDWSTKVTIVCPEHGDFEQRPHNHFNGKGCSACGREKVGNKKRSSTEEFIQKAKEIHNDKYDYSLSKYITATVKVKIICPDHGEFEQVPYNHLSGKGCPRCKESKGEALIADILKRNNIDFIREYKIPEVKKEYEYDFYLKDHNLLIEFHGIQHYELNKFFHRSAEKFLHQVVTDRTKMELAKVWKYNFLCLRFDIVNILSKEEFETLLLKYIFRTSKRNTNA